jgi:hypothetical protein
VVATDARTERKRNAILIPRNTPLPVTAKRVFRTQKAGQKSILVQIVEGESAMPEDCSQIGRCVARDLPADMPAQTPIEVRFSYQENGRLTVNVNVAGTKRELKHEITRDNTMTQEQLDAWRQFVTGLPPSDTMPIDARDSSVEPAAGPAGGSTVLGGSTVFGGSSVFGSGGSSLAAGSLSDAESGEATVIGSSSIFREEGPPPKSGSSVDQGDSTVIGPDEDIPVEPRE